MKCIFKFSEIFGKQFSMSAVRLCCPRIAPNGQRLGVGGGFTTIRVGDTFANLHKHFCVPTPPLMPNRLLSAAPLSVVVIYSLCVSLVKFLIVYEVLLLRF